MENEEKLKMAKEVEENCAEDVEMRGGELVRGDEGR